MKLFQTPNLIISIFLSMCVLSANADVKPFQISAKKYRQKLANAAKNLAKTPTNKLTMQRYHLEYEMAVASLDLDKTKEINLDVMLKKCAASKSQFLIFGEAHAGQESLKIDMISKLAELLKDKPRVLAHEALLVEWRPWLENLKPGELDLDTFTRNLVDKAIETYKPELDKLRGSTSSYVKTKMTRNFSSIAEICWCALQNGFELKPVDSRHLSGEAMLALADFRNIEAFDFMTYQVSRDKLMHACVKKLKRFKDKPFLFMITGEHHTLGKGRVYSLWSGEKPMMILSMNSLIPIELKERISYNRGSYYQISPTVFFVASKDMKPLGFPVLLEALSTF